MKGYAFMNEYVFGANILENLTTGMYQDSRVIYREYIQNACDQIDKARGNGVLSVGKELIDIQLNEKERTITITDNATGIPMSKFREVLANIADSDKQIGEAKGFRGIGRLCGLAYCRELVFASKAPGEAYISVLRCNAEKMRELIDKNNRGEKISANDLLNHIYAFPTPIKTDRLDDHWFKVELIGVNKENHDLLDFQNVKDYLSFVAPVPYKNTFIFRKKVYDHANQIGVKIDEYKITLNGETILKNYGTRFCTSKGEDEIFDVEFEEFYDDSNQLIAWSWFGLSHFKAIIHKECQMRGLRLRKENIQIGDDDALKKLFKEDRGSHYFIGEVFAVSRGLIPNSQRDYFNENEPRLQFEQKVRRFFNDELTRLYRDGSDINSAFKKIDDYQKKACDYSEKQRNGDFVDDDHRKKAEEAVKKAKIEAEKAKENIEKKKQKVDQDPNNPTRKILTRIEAERKKQETKESKTPDKKKVKEDTNANKQTTEKVSRRVDKLTAIPKKDRKIISRIFSIILESTDENTAETIITKIEEEFK